jgi:hypothetical protein
MKFDIVIPYHSKDEYTIKNCVNSCSHIKEKQNIFIVSKKELNVPGTIWINENIFPFNTEKIIKLNSSIPEHRAGWYLQQLIKLYSFIIPNITDNFLVLDSDVIFQKDITFFGDNIPLYSFSNEYTHEYFECMNSLNSFFERSVNVSGICHHMMFEKEILLEIFKLIEKPNKEIWESIIENIKNWHHGFSEYELYFHYINKKYPKKYSIRKLYYEDVDDFMTHTPSNNLDYIANHAWRRQK